MKDWIDLWMKVLSVAVIPATAAIFNLRREIDGAKKDLDNLQQDRAEQNEAHEKMLDLLGEIRERLARLEGPKAH
jgi:hypothetical protein